MSPLSALSLFFSASANPALKCDMIPFVHDAVLDMHMAREDLLAAFGDVGERDWDRYVPSGSRTLHDLLAHLAGADQAWALAAQGLLRGEGAQTAPLAPA